MARAAVNPKNWRDLIKPQALETEQETLTQDEGYPTIKGCEIAQFSPINGKLLAAVSFEGVHVIDVETKQQLRLIEKKSIIAMEWSPKEKYIITCQKFKEG